MMKHPTNVFWKATQCSSFKSCLCISKIETHECKLLPKCKKAVFTGHDGSSPAYYLFDFVKKKFYRSRNVTFFEKQFPGLDNGSRPAIVLLFQGGNDSVGAVTDSVGVNNAQTNATDANEVLPTLEQPLSPTRGATSTTIDTSQSVSSAPSPHNVQMEIQDTPIYLDTRENYTTRDDFDISDAIESSPQTPTADNRQNITSPTPDSAIKFLPKRSTSSKSREQSGNDEEHSTALGIDIPTTNRTGRMFRRPAWHYDCDFSTDENCNFAMAASVNGKVPLNYEEAILSPDAEKWQTAMQNEFKSLVENKTWDLVALPSGKPLTNGFSKWFFDIKRKSDGSIERYSARYVAKGFSQIYGQNYTDTFSPTILSLVNVMYASSINAFTV